MPLQITLNEDGTASAELKTTVQQMTAIIRKAMATAPGGIENPQVTIKFGMQRMSVKANPDSKPKTSQS